MTLWLRLKKTSISVNAANIHAFVSGAGWPGIGCTTNGTG